MTLIFLWNIWTWIAGSFCLVVFFMMLIGKLAPKFGTCLMAGILLLGLLSNYIPLPSDESGKGHIPNPIHGGGNDCDIYELPRKYVVKDEKLWTYSTSGDWELSTRFVERFECETGWKKVKRKGNYTIALIYKGIISDSDADGERKFIYSGGEIGVRVNGELCCCGGVLLIPAGLTGKSVKVVNQEIQKKITELMTQNEEAVIRKIHACF